jgi:hypothetical protein
MKPVIPIGYGHLLLFLIGILIGLGVIWIISACIRAWYQKEEAFQAPPTPPLNPFIYGRGQVTSKATAPPKNELDLAFERNGWAKAFHDTNSSMDVYLSNGWPGCWVMCGGGWSVRGYPLRDILDATSGDGRYHGGGEYRDLAMFLNEVGPTAPKEPEPEPESLREPPARHRGIRLKINP